MGLKTHEKFWAFTVLILAIVGIAIIATMLGGALSRYESYNEAAQATLVAKIRILELVAVGLIGIAGAAGQALFRTSETAGQMNAILEKTIEGLKHSRPVSPNELPSSDAAGAAEQVADAANREADKIVATADTNVDPWKKVK